MKYLNIQSLAVNLILLFLVFSIKVNAQNAGSLDTTFGSGGTVVTRLSEAATLYDMAVQPDKKIVMVGTTFDPMVVLTVGMIARFNENGTLDTTFDMDGFNNQTPLKSINSVEILPDGKIMVGGYIETGNTIHFCIGRFNSNGTLDTTFDGDGIVQTTVGIASSINSINILPDGKILAVGWTSLLSSTNRDYALVRYNADGSLDTTFGTNGRVATELGSSEFAYDSAIQADGKIVVAGDFTETLANQKMAAIVRYNANGSVDTLFGNNGKVFRAAASNAEADEVAIQSDGKIIIVGIGIPPVRYNPDGSFDTEFNTPAWSGTSALTIQSDRKILVGGGTTIARYNINGTLDSSFGTGGTISNSAPKARISMAPDGKIVVGGTTFSGNFTIVLARYLNNITNQSGLMDFDGDSKTDISIFRPSVGEWWINRSSSGQTVAAQFGSATDKITPGDFTGDGKTDIAFWRGSTGFWYVLRSEDSSFFAFPFGASGDIPVVGNFDADGKADPGVFRPSNSTWYISLSAGGTLIRQFGTSGDVPVVADYDGDGKSDIAIFRANGVSGAEWWIARSAAGIAALQFGSSTDKAVPGDYTGDGKSDIAFFRPETGFWYVLRSEDFSFFSFPFGANGDIPAPGDYDGDGKFDAAVFRPSNATWYVNRSSSGVLITSFGTTGDMPVPNAFVP